MASTTTIDFGRLCDYRTGTTLRRATATECAASLAAAQRDGGRGVIEIDGRACYVESPDLVLCESADGWSLHAPGSTDEQIASGDAPPLASGEPLEDEEVCS